MCLHGNLCSIHFNLICNMTTFRKKVLTIGPTPGVEGVLGENIWLHLAASVIPFKLI